MNANEREYPVALDECAWAIPQRIERVRLREFPWSNPLLLTPEGHGKSIVTDSRAKALLSEQEA